MVVGIASPNIVVGPGSAFTLTGPTAYATDDLTLSADCTISPWSDPVAGDVKNIYVRQPKSGGTYNYALSWFGFSFPGGPPMIPALSTGAGNYDLYRVTYDGAFFNLVVVGQEFFPSPTFEGSVAVVSSGNPFTVTLDAATNQNDCLIVALSSAGSPTFGISGAGATWSECLFDNGPTPSRALWVGYGCDEGETTIDVSGIGSGNGGVVVARFSNLPSASNPFVIGDINGDSSWTTLSTPSESYDAYGVVVGVACGYGVSSLTASWGNGETNQQAGFTGSARPCSLDFILPLSAGATDVTYTANIACAGGVMIGVFSQ